MDSVAHRSHHLSQHKLQHLHELVSFRQSDLLSLIAFVNRFAQSGERDGIDVRRSNTLSDDILEYLRCHVDNTELPQFFLARRQEVGKRFEMDRLWPYRPMLQFRLLRR